MKLSKLFVIALLVGTLGVIGCGSDPAPEGNGGSGGNGTAGTGGDGTAGTGGTGEDVCTGGDCVDGSTEKELCEIGVAACRLNPIGVEACIQATVEDNCHL